MYTDVMVLQDRELIDRYGFLQKIVKIDPEKENAETVAKRELEQSAKMTETQAMRSRTTCAVRGVFSRMLRQRTARNT